MIQPIHPSQRPSDEAEILRELDGLRANLHLSRQKLSEVRVQLASSQRATRQWRELTLAHCRADIQNLSWTVYCPIAGELDWLNRTSTSRSLTPAEEQLRKRYHFLVRWGMVVASFWFPTLAQRFWQKTNRLRRQAEYERLKLLADAILQQGLLEWQLHNDAWTNREQHIYWKMIEIRKDIRHLEQRIADLQDEYNLSWTDEDEQFIRHDADLPCSVIVLHQYQIE